MPRSTARKGVHTHPPKSAAPTLPEWVDLLNLAPEVPLATAQLHPVFRKLAKNASFRRARAVFLRLLPGSSELVLARTIAEWRLNESLNRMLAPPASKGRGRGDARSRKRVLRSLNSLLAQSRFVLADPREQQTLTALLEKLRAEIDGSPRKQHEILSDTAQFARLQLALLLRGLGVYSPTIVQHVSDMVGTPCDRRTAQRCVAFARSMQEVDPGA